MTILLFHTIYESVCFPPPHLSLIWTRTHHTFVDCHSFIGAGPCPLLHCRRYIHSDLQKPAKNKLAQTIHTSTTRWLQYFFGVPSPSSPSAHYYLSSLLTATSPASTSTDSSCQVSPLTRLAQLHHLLSLGLSTFLITLSSVPTLHQTLSATNRLLQLKPTLPLQQGERSNFSGRNGRLTRDQWSITWRHAPESARMLIKLNCSGSRSLSEDWKAQQAATQRATPVVGRWTS